jgi:hypothetical protein
LAWVDLALFLSESDWIGGGLAEGILIFGRELDLDKVGGGGRILGIGRLVEPGLPAAGILDVRCQQCYNPHRAELEEPQTA